MRPLLLLVVLLLSACSKPALVAPAATAPRLGADWFAWRAETLGVSADEARARELLTEAGLL